MSHFHLEMVDKCLSFGNLTVKASAQLICSFNLL